MMRVLGILFTVLFAIASAVLTWPQFFRLERTYPIAQIVSFRAVVVLAFAAVAILGLLLMFARPMRGFAASLALIALLAGGVNAGILVARGLGSDALPAQTETSIRVMTWNTAGEATGAEDIARAAIDMDADIVSLPETTLQTGGAVAEQMRDLGKPMWALNARYPGWDAQSTTILISPDLGEYSVIESSQDGSSNTSWVPSAVAMPVDGDGPIIVAVHAVAPRADYMEDWSNDLRWLADQCAVDGVILAGDFNATIDHMAGLGVDGATLGNCSDTTSTTGNGGVGTWATDVPALLGAPIDHVMVSDGWRATGSVVIRSMDDAGTDHRPIVVQLEPTR
jgi:endonuclease/exonuclease/phosphatase (EEP) superfamily protein YafD